MAKKIAGWDARVREAEREPVEFDLPDGTVVRVEKITGGQARRLKRTDDEEDQLEILFGAKKAAKILDAYEDAPASVLTGVLQDIFDHFNGDKGKAPRLSSVPSDD